MLSKRSRRDRRSGTGCLDKNKINIGPVGHIGPMLYSSVMRKIDRDFSLIRTDRRVVPSGRLWNPAADVYRSSDGWIVKVDLAGVCSDELEIELREQFLNIRG